MKEEWNPFEQQTIQEKQKTERYQALMRMLGDNLSGLIIGAVIISIITAITVLWRTAMLASTMPCRDIEAKYEALDSKLEGLTMPRYYKLLPITEQEVPDNRKGVKVNGQ